MAVVKPSPKRVTGYDGGLKPGTRSIDVFRCLFRSSAFWLLLHSSLSLSLTFPPSLFLFFSFFSWRRGHLKKFCSTHFSWMNIFPLLGNSVENEERKRERERDEVEECKALHANKMKNAQWIWNDDDNRIIFWILDFVKRCWIDEKFFDLNNLIILSLRRIWKGYYYIG